MKTDRVVLITGAGGGMGSLFVARFLANGDTVVAIDTPPIQITTAKTWSARAKMTSFMMDNLSQAFPNILPRQRASQFALEQTAPNRS